ncbi:ketopantoate reductase family protein [Microvirga calopogonii]|uniref:ketopantoate reductase family protein n=1 Tax=Microvirga calopogonii TaxID=2078013 RepID=UPI000E0D4055|nr:2-dehydropantoate 2-reductase [Microvirga calopogonii]
MRIAVMGAGGIGGYLGGRLAAVGEEVAFVARGAHLEALRQNGLHIESPFGDLHLPQVIATDAPAEIDPVDLVLFTVKLYDSERAAAALAPLVGRHTRVLTLQNGIDSLDILARHVPSGQLIGGSIYVAASIARPGVISVPGGSRRLVVEQASDPVVQTLRQACERGVGIDIETVEDVAPVLWEKFVILCAFAGATTLMRAGIGTILADPEARLFIEQLRDEGLAVAAASGHPVPEEHHRRFMVLWQALPPETRSSMANDLARGKRLELEWLSGRMHALGADLGVPTPAHTAVYRALHLHAHPA